MLTDQAHDNLACNSSSKSSTLDNTSLTTRCHNEKDASAQETLTEELGNGSDMCHNGLFNILSLQRVSCGTRSVSGDESGQEVSSTTKKERLENI